MKGMKRYLGLLLSAVMAFGSVQPAGASTQTESVPVVRQTKIDGNLLADAVLTVSSEASDHMANGEKTGPARYLVDGDRKTRWAASTTGNEWIQFDFGESREIGSLIITWEPAFASDYSVMISEDDVNYTTVFHDTPSSKPGEIPIEIHASCRYLKLTMDKAGFGYPYSIYEMEVRAPGSVITALEETGTETVVGTAPVLPEKVRATYSDGKQSDLKVSWDSIPARSYSEVGSFEVLGTVSGTSLRARCLVTVTPADEEQYLRLAKKQVGGRVLVPADDYADENAVAEAATRAAQEKITLGDTAARVTWEADRYVLTLTNGSKSRVLDPFTVSLPADRDSSGRYELREERIELARQIGGEGVILLKNENAALPLTQKDQVAVFGRMQVDTIRGGLGAAYMDPAYEVSVLDGLRNAGVHVDETLADIYETWCSDPANKKEEVIYTSDRFFPEMPLTEEQVRDARERDNKAVVVIGRIVGENNDMQNNKGGWLLTDEETEMLRLVTRYFDQVAVVYNNGVVADMEFAEELGVEALVFMGYGGQEGGSYVGDVLSGRVTPSGKLTETVAKSYDAYPADGFSGGTTQNYTEDIYTGYRYFETFDPDYETVRYPFGYGLSYTDFEISGVSARQTGTHLEVRATVTNTGKRYPGKEVLQVYYSAPQMGTGSAVLGKPGKALAAFGKTELLHPGESQTLTLSFPVADMASYDDTGITGHRNAWLLEEGDYRLFVGNSIRDAGTRQVYTYNQKEMRVIDEDLTQLDTMLPDRLLADGTYEELEVLEIPGHINIKNDVLNHAEAENYKSAGSGVTERDGALSIPEGQAAEYSLQIVKGGKYQLKLQYSNEGEAVKLADALQVYVGGNQVNISDFVMLEKGSSLETAAIPVGFPTGDVTFRFAGKGAGNILWDSFTLERNNAADAVHEIPSDGVGKVECEDYVDASSGVRSEDFQDDGKGNPGSCLSNMRSGSRVNYKLKVEETGIYRMVIHYAAVGETKLNNTATFLINNITQTFGDDISFKNTAIAGNTYYNFVDLEPLTVLLPGGEATLTVESQIAAFPNFDYITFEKAENSVSGKKTARSADLSFEDVAENPELLDEFVAQLTVSQLALFGSGHGNVVPNTNTGSIGNIPSLEIPGVQTADGPTGVRLSGTTDPIAWPSTNVMASSWNEQLCEEYGLAFGRDIADFDVNCILGPSINIQRNPLGGRNFEYYSEDPYLTGKLGAAVTRGIQSVGVAAAVKHFAVNSTEYSRLASNSIVSARAMREVYLKAFEIVIKEADPWSIMTSYNFINGTKAAELEPVMNGIARGEWGYDGVFMTDWGNDSNIVKEAQATGDVKMPSGDSSALANAVNSGILERSCLEAAAARILKLALKTDSLRREEPVDHLAVNMPAQASGSESTEHSPAGAVDGLMDTRWATGSVLISSKPWFQADLGQSRDLGFLRISWEHAPKSYEIQVSDDGVSYDTVASYNTTDASGKENEMQEFELTDVSGRYVRMQATELWDIWGASIYEFEVYDSSYVPPVEEEKAYAVLTRSASVLGESTGLSEGDFVSVTADKAPSGFRFSGWSAVGLQLTSEQRGNEKLSFSMPAGNVILTAHFVPGDTQEDSAAMVKAELDRLIALMESLNPEEYTAESRAEAEKALAAAKEVRDREAVSCEELDRAFADLIKAFGGLEYGVQKQHLKTAIEAAETILAQGQDYEETRALAEAVDQGKAVLEEGTAAQEEVDAAACAVLNELFRMAKKADLVSLESLIEAAVKLVDEKYTDSSLDRLKDAIEKAGEVAADQNREQSDISRAYENLVKAVMGLERKGNKAALDATIKKAREVLEKKEAYAAETLEGLEETLKEAAAVFENQEAVQSEVNDAVKELTRKLAKVRLLGDVDGSGTVTTGDATELLKAAAEQTVLSGPEEASADVNRDKAADTKDAVLILQYAAEQISGF